MTPEIAFIAWSFALLVLWLRFDLIDWSGMGGRHA
jgi:hypothetical protein